MYTQNTACLASPTLRSRRTAAQPIEAAATPKWLASGLLIVASAILCALAFASAWLSYHAQVAYVLAHNGNQRMEARVWALLLDSGTAGVSVLRLYEALRRSAGAGTRLTLLGCIAASVAMNLLHSPSRSAGGYLVAAVPPVMYAVFLEHLLTNLRNILVAGQERRSMWRTVALWFNFPAVMWSRWRSTLRHDADGVVVAPETTVDADEDAHCESVENPHAAQTEGQAVRSDCATSVRALRRGRGPGPKRVAFEAALTAQVCSGDLRLFSEDERERNAAAYQAAASLPDPLSPGTARRYVVQALPRLEVTRAARPRAAGEV